MEWNGNMKLSYRKIVSDGNLLVLRDDAERRLQHGKSRFR